MGSDMTTLSESRRLNYTVSSKAGGALKFAETEAEDDLRMSGSAAVAVESWAFGPSGRARTGGRLRPLGVTAGILAATGAALAIGFVTFVNVMGSDDAVAPPAVQTVAVEAQPAAVAPIAQPLVITDVQLTDAVDPVTGEPMNPTRTFGIGEPVHLWLSLEVGDATGSLTAVWFRGEKKVARLTAPLPDAALQMVFPLPELSVDRPGSYRVEVRSHGEVLTAESFEVTNG
jgi:hypothetical protein